MIIKKWIVFLKEHLIVRTLLLISVTAMVLLCLVLWWLSAYTRHGQAISVPDIGRMQVQDAAALLARHHLKCEIIDSIYYPDAIPGSIIDQTPPEGSLVKENRIVFVTINARSPRKTTVPDVKDMSHRQAVALLKGMGFPEPATEYVPSEYRDLVIEVCYNGQPVERGTKMPINARLTLRVGNGYMDSTLLPDSGITDTEMPLIDEGWLE
ncbi:MAG: PASTA domain-containing protein [Coprobacter sp.]|nr:PASTA domain-containing protein [Coprobacter sp.]